MLDLSDEDDFADWASRAALKLHPDDPDLLWRRILLLPGAPALDVVARLARLPGRAAEAGLARDAIRLGLSPPADRDFSYHYFHIARRLLYVGDPAAALRRADEGLALDLSQVKNPDECRRELLGARAMALALLGRPAEAMAAQSMASFPQVEVEGRWRGLGDVLMTQGKPALAAKSFGGLVPDDAEAARVFALALEADGRPDQAIKVLDAKKPEVWDRLLAIRILLRADKPEEAVRRGREVIEPISNYTVGSYAGPLLRDGSRAASLRPEYLAAAGWLLKTFPFKEKGIAYNLGGPDTEVSPYRPWPLTDKPASELIPSLRAQLAAEKDSEKQTNLRRWLARTLFDAGDFAGAADALAPLARVPRDEQKRLNPDAVTWCLYREQAEAEAAYRRAPEGVMPARRLLADLGSWRGVGRPTGVVDALVELGPAALAPAMWRLAPWRGPGLPRQNPSAFLPVVAALGGPHDAPLLIAQLPDSDDARDPPRLPPDAADAALRRITGETASPAGRAERLTYWLDWWDAHGPALMAGKN